MTPADTASFLEELARQKGQLWVEGGDLQFRSPSGVLTPELRTRISANRASIVAQSRVNAHCTSCLGT